MSWNMPDGASSDQYDRYMGYDQPDEEEPEEMDMEITASTVHVDGCPVDYSGLPENHRETVRLYIEHGCHPGSGWLAILQGKLQALLMVDKDTAAALPQIVGWLRWNAPSECHGSPEAVNGWMAAHRARENRR